MPKNWNMEKSQWMGLIAIWRHDLGFYKYVQIWEADLVKSQVNEGVEKRIVEARLKLTKNNVPDNVLYMLI